MTDPYTELEQARAALAQATSTTEEQARARAAELLAAAAMREEQAALARRVAELELETLRENIRQAAAAMPRIVADRDAAADTLDARLLELRPIIEALAEQEAAIRSHHDNMRAACEAAARKGTPLEGAGESTLIPAMPAPRYQAASPSEVAGPYGAAGYLSRRVMALRDAGMWPARL